MSSISVYITSYNQVSLLQDAIFSVLGQTLKPSEIIIVDDCSTDGSQDLISSLANLYPDVIRPIFHKKNLGVAQARVTALREVKSDYITYLDGDDLFLPTKLEEEYLALEKNKDVDIVFSNTAYINSNLSKILWVWVENEKPPSGNIFPDTFARNFPKRSIFRMEMVNYIKFSQIGFHDAKLTTFEDYDMRIRLTYKLKATYIDKVLSLVRMGDSGLSTKFYEHIQNLEYIFNKNFGLLAQLDEETKKMVERSFWEYCIRIIRGNLGYKELLKSPLKYFTYKLKYLELNKKVRALIDD